jgi:nucleoid DNA-binding protein
MRRSASRKGSLRTWVESVFDVLKEVLENGEETEISGFGTFRVKEKSPRNGGDSTGSIIEVLL